METGYCITFDNIHVEVHPTAVKNEFRYRVQEYRNKCDLIPWTVSVGDLEKAKRQAIRAAESHLPDELKGKESWTGWQPIAFP